MLYFPSGGLLVHQIISEFYRHRSYSRGLACLICSMIRTDPYVKAVNKRDIPATTISSCIKICLRLRVATFETPSHSNDAPVIPPIRSRCRDRVPPSSADRCHRWILHSIVAWRTFNHNERVIDQAVFPTDQPTNDNNTSLLPAGATRSICVQIIRLESSDNFYSDWKTISALQ